MIRIFIMYIISMEKCICSKTRAINDYFYWKYTT